ncbi:site-2 protease family protein [Candidatus Uhrbacteria bacterium]|nr:site-2 protease family protein [Candidatus Uhrbacteria bacterium]
MALNLLFTDPPIFFAWILAVLIAVTVHEFSHALTATMLGDRTPGDHGRLTFDPRAHVDMMGLLMLVLVGFGWGKPVPFNPHNLRFPRWGATLVALAGPFANLLSIIFFGGAAVILLRFGILASDNLLVSFLFLLVTVNAVLLLFNLIPIPPLDGSKVLLDALHHPRYEHIRFLLETRGPLLLLGLVLLDTFLPFSIFGTLFSGVLSFIYRTLFSLT